MSATPAWKVWLVLIGVFVAGGVVGGMVALRVHEHMVERGRTGQYAARMVKKYADRLELTEEQRQQAEQLMKDSWAESRELRERNREHLRQLGDDIAELLTPEQRVKYEALMDERRRRMKEAIERRKEMRARGEDGPPQGRDGSRRPRGEDPAPPPPES